MQSERLNQFHNLFLDLSKQLGVEGFKGLALTSPSKKCESDFRRSLAALHSIDGFFEGSYSISKDSVFINLHYISTGYIDRNQNMPSVYGSLEEFNSVIQRLVMASLTVVSFRPDTLHMLQIAEYIKNDGIKYDISHNNSFHANLEIGKIAYSMGGYDKAAEQLLQIEPGNPQYGEAQFILGKCILISNNYNQALNYFRNSQRAGFNQPELSDYIYQTERLNKPWHWFDSEKKRREWWFSLTSEETTQIIQLLNSLNVHNKKYHENYVYVDADILALFESEVIAIKKVNTADLACYRFFNRCNLMIFDDCKISSGQGIANFNHLKIIESNKKEILRLEDLEDFTRNQNITVLHR